MNAPAHHKSSVITPAEFERITSNSKLALSMMQKHQVAALPENYAVWYHYVLSGNKELVHEIDTLINGKVPFTVDTGSYLYNKYVHADQGGQAVDDASHAAGKVLADIVRMVNSFKTETTSFNQDIDGYMQTMSKQIGDEDLQSVVKELLAATANVRGRGDALNRKLEESQKEIDTLRKNLEKVTSESQRDFLTGVYNRKAMDKMLDEQMALVREEKGDLCLLLADVDHFKRFNDNFGHLLGDEVLKIVARTLVDCVKGKDIVARFGGEEFAVLLPATPVKGALIVAESVRASIASRELKRKDTGQNFGSITVSVGISLYRPESDTVPTFIKRADDALYAAKHAGRNRVMAEAPAA